MRHVVLVTLLLLASRLGAQSPFIRGDFNGDAAVDLSDAVRILLHLFRGAPAPECRATGDVDDNDAIQLTDAVHLLGSLFSRGSPPAAPYPLCGEDATVGAIDCEAYAPCLAQDTAPAITEWTVPWSNSRPRDPYVGADGRVWFVGQNADYAAHLVWSTGEFTRFDLGSDAGPHNLIVGDQVWYAGNGDAHIGKLDPDSGEIVEYSMPDAAARDPHTLIFDPAGDIWFTVQRGNFIGKLTTATGQVRLEEVPTSNARPYGIVLDSAGRPWVALFGTNKLARVNPVTFQIDEFTLPRSGARPRRLVITSDDSVWYVDHSGGYLGRLEPPTGEVEEWRAPGGGGSRPYGMAVDDRDRVWFVETGLQPNRFVGFNPARGEFFGITAIPSGGGTVRHMYFDPARREIWFGTDANTIGRARL